MAGAGLDPVVCLGGSPVVERLRRHRGGLSGDLDLDSSTRLPDAHGDVERGRIGLYHPSGQAVVPGVRHGGHSRRSGWQPHGRSADRVPGRREPVVGSRSLSGHRHARHETGVLVLPAGRQRAPVGDGGDGKGCRLDSLQSPPQARRAGPVLVVRVVLPRGVPVQRGSHRHISQRD